jgi:hypothetical protein
MGLSQTLPWTAGWAGWAPFSDFVKHRNSEADREQAVLLPDGPGVGKAEALAQPQWSSPKPSAPIARKTTVFQPLKPVRFACLKFKALGGAAMSGSRTQAAPF